ncbi:MAG: hypothetical protein F8N39_12040 [Clostridiaceae bacterium]|nr:hypothetical protein [Clostridiaceae bacterium]
MSIEKHIKPKLDIVSENKLTVNITNKSKDVENFSTTQGEGSIDKNVNTMDKNVSNPDTHGFKPKNMTKNPEPLVEESTENCTDSSIETSQNNGQYNKHIEDDYQGSYETIETELKKLESNFTKIFNESKSQQQDIVKLNNLVAKYKNLLCEKDTQIEELKVDRKKLEEKVLEYKNQYQTVLNEMCSVKNQINKFIGNLAD